MAKNTLLKDSDRDFILMASVIYRKSITNIARETGFSMDAVSRTINCYELVNAEKWDALAAKCSTRVFSKSLLAWAEKANQKKVPQDVLDMIFPKPEPPKEEPAKEKPPKPDAPKAEPSLDKLIEQNEQIISCLRALADGMPQILTAISYIDKRIKDEFHGNFDPLMGYVKTINENLVGVKCNTRLLKKLEDK